MQGEASTSCTPQRIGEMPPVLLTERDVEQQHRCAAGAHIVFIGTSGLGSMVMRGQLTHSVLNQSIARHGARSSYFSISNPANSTKEWKMVTNHFQQFGPPSACVIIKYSVAWVGAACRSYGALVLVDCIDNHRAYTASNLHNVHYEAMDAIVVQTSAHAAMVASLGRLAVVLPHPHGNLGSWGVANEVRHRVRNLGFVSADARNMPTGEDMRLFRRACCRMNVTLYMLSSKSSGLGMRPVALNCSNMATQPSSAPWQPHQNSSLSCLTRHAESAAARRSSIGFAAELRTGYSSSQIQDPTRQRRYYDTPEMLDLIDVGLVWKPGHQQGGQIAVLNRPPTRLHWWWSHGLPVIGYPMIGYVDAAQRAGYPSGLLNVTSSDQLEAALAAIAPARERSCLQRAARRGASLSSPWYASVELLAAICAVGERCRQPLQNVGIVEQTEARP